MGAFRTRRTHPHGNARSAQIVHCPAGQSNTLTMLLDSNLIIYAVQPAHQQLRNFIAATGPAVSGISYVEVLGYHKLTPVDRGALQKFFNSARMLPIDRNVRDQAVLLRQQRRMSLGDSLIASTAMVHQLTPATHNTADFAWVAGLRLHDPLVSGSAP